MYYGADYILQQLRLIYISVIKINHMEKRIVILWGDIRGVSPVIGVILMVFLTILLAGVTVSAVYGDGISTSLSSAPMVYVKAGSEGSTAYHVGLGKNFIFLEHAGGEPLSVDSTKIVIIGEGRSYTSNFIGGMNLYGDVLVSYDNLLFDGKESAYASRNSVLSDGLWSAGETLILNGHDSIDGTSASSVSVSINGITNTSNNYGLRENVEITIKILDLETQCVIAECECKVVPAE
jgi:flagellin-like protein